MHVSCARLVNYFTGTNISKIFWFHSRGCMHIVKMDELLISFISGKRQFGIANDKKHYNMDYVKILDWDSNRIGYFQLDSFRHHSKIIKKLFRPFWKRSLKILRFSPSYFPIRELLIDPFFPEILWLYHQNLKNDIFCHKLLIVLMKNPYWFTHLGVFIQRFRTKTTSVRLV